jgi:hypothetical protein
MPVSLVRKSPPRRRVVGKMMKINQKARSMNPLRSLNGMTMNQPKKRHVGMMMYQSKSPLVGMMIPQPKSPLVGMMIHQPRSLLVGMMMHRAERPEGMMITPRNHLNGTIPLHRKVPRIRFPNHQRMVQFIEQLVRSMKL